MTHNPAAAHPRLMALLDYADVILGPAHRALPPLLADLRTRAEEECARWRHIMDACRDWQCMTDGEECDPGTLHELDLAATAHHACCTTALAAAAGTPALAQEVAALKEVLDAG